MTAIYPILFFMFFLAAYTVRSDVVNEFSKQRDLVLYIHL